MVHGLHAPRDCVSRHGPTHSAIGKDMLLGGLGLESTGMQRRKYLVLVEAKRSVSYGYDSHLAQDVD